MTATTAPAHGASHTGRQQTIANGKLAMWIFLSSEVMFFAGLLGSFVVLRISNPEVFHPKYLEEVYHSALNVPLAGFNTLALITSSLTMALAVHGAQTRNNAKLRSMLVVTAALGVLFCIVKYFEYNAKFSHHVYPSTSIFYSCYFALTGIHVLHVIGGVVPIFAMAVLGGDGRFIRPGSITIECMGLYWHFVDVVWIFLFPLLYLVK